MSAGQISKAKLARPGLTVAVPAKVTGAGGTATATRTVKVTR